MSRFPAPAPSFGQQADASWLADGLAERPSDYPARGRRSRLRAGVAAMLLGAARPLARWRITRPWASVMARLAHFLTRSVHPSAPLFGGPAGSLLRAGRLGRAVWAQVLDIRPRTNQSHHRLPSREMASEPFLLLVRSLRSQHAVALTCRPLVPRSRIAVTRRHPGGRTAMLYVVQESRHVGDGVFRVMLVLTSRLYRSLG